MIKAPLIFNFLVEGSVAFLLFISPQTLYNTPLNPEMLGLARAFGVAALIIALVSFKIAFTDSTAAVRWGLLMVFVYHLGIGIVQLLHPMPDMNPLIAPMFHGVLSLWALGSYASLRKWN